MNNGHDHEEFREVISRIKKDTNDLGLALRGCANQTASDVQENVNRSIQQARDAVNGYVEHYAEQTRQRPIASIAKWAGIGFLVGWLMRRR